MTDDEIYDKTAAGREELQHRSADLPQRVRAILIMVDGARSVGELRAAMERGGAPADALDMLVQRNLIARARMQAARGRAGQASGAAPLATAPGPLSTSPAELRPHDSEFPVPTSNDVERFRETKKFMNDTIVDAMGIRSFMFTLKLEKCATLADLAAIAPAYVKNIHKARGDAIASALRAKLKEMLR